MYVLLSIPLIVGLSIALYIKLKAAEHKIAVLLEKLKFRDIKIDENWDKISELENSIERMKLENLKAEEPSQVPAEKANKKRKYYRRPKA